MCVACLFCSKNILYSSLSEVKSTLSTFAYICDISCCFHLSLCSVLVYTVCVHLVGVVEGVVYSCLQAWLTWPKWWTVELKISLISLERTFLQLRVIRYTLCCLSLISIEVPSLSPSQIKRAVPLLLSSMKAFVSLKEANKNGYADAQENRWGSLYN